MPETTNIPANNTPDVIPPTPEDDSSTNVLAVAALVTGLLGFGIVPIVLGVLGLKKPGGRGMSIAGIVLGALSLIASIIIVALIIIAAINAPKNLPPVVNEPNPYQAEQQEILDAKKDFAKGEMGRFGYLEVKAEITNNNYIPKDKYFQPDEGKKYIVVNVSVKNIGKNDAYLSNYSFEVKDENGAVSTSNLAKSPGKPFPTITLIKDAEVTGEIVYEVDKKAGNFKLVYDDASVYSYKTGTTVQLTYTLAL